jgi:hypothetical protein
MEAPAPSTAPASALITGGTGFIGRALVQSLAAEGIRPVVITRRAAEGRRLLGDAARLVEADPTQAGPWQEVVAGVRWVYNLAGASVGERRWNARYREGIYESRVETTRLLVEAVGRTPAAQRPEVLVSASGVDFYPSGLDLTGFDDDDDIVETAPAGDSFLARVCRDWELEAREATAHGLRVVTMRCGLVLGRGGPADRLVQLFRTGLGGPIGTGRQWMSWVHLEDAVRAYRFAAATPALSGPVNLVAPEAVRNRDFARALGRALGRPAVVPVPAFALRAALGEFSEYVLGGRKVVPAALRRTGFEFRYPDLAAALATLR